MTKDANHWLIWLNDKFDELLNTSFIPQTCMMIYKIYFSHQDWCWGFLSFHSRFIHCFNKKTRSSSCLCFPFHVLHPLRLQEPWSSVRYEELLVVDFDLNVRSLNSTVWCWHGLQIGGLWQIIKRFGPYNLDLTYMWMHLLVKESGCISCHETRKSFHSCRSSTCSLLGWKWKLQQTTFKITMVTFNDIIFGFWVPLGWLGW